MLKIGLTGEMGSGKTFVADLFAAKGIPVYNCDRASKILVSTNEELISQIKRHFGENIYEGNVFKNLSEMVFIENGDKNLKILSDLIHPCIYKDIDKFVEDNKHKGAGFCLIESAILYENKMEKNLDMVIYVSVPETIRKERTIKRDNITEKEYDIRMQTQIQSRDKLSKANYIVYNSGSNDTPKRVDDIYNALQWTIHCTNRGDEIYY